MLFNSLPFLFVFFPITLTIFFLLGRFNRMYAGFWLAGSSLFFYGWWNAAFVTLLVGSVVFNYTFGYVIARDPSPRRKQLCLIVAVAADLSLLAYYKYADIAREIGGYSPHVGAIFLPLGISFFTFTQIAFLVDAYRGQAREFNFVHYLLFVTYFPHLIAGPILHHAQMMPQFAEKSTYRINWTNIAVGLTVFIIGLAKKALIADTFAKIASPVFQAAQHGASPPLIESWAGALAYTLQLYFDFSGYSDMAIGLSLFFNVKLPLNFNSPYKAVNIVDFWRRWHMTLSRFLRDYLYFTLGGNRKGKVQRYRNLLITMLLGGLWHGAGWTFVVWGGLHGLYLIVNHAFQALCDKVGWKRGRLGHVGRVVASATTFVSVVIAWVFFRADTFHTASTLLHGMVGIFGLRHANSWLPSSGLNTVNTVVLIAVGLAIVWLLPNSQEFVRRYVPSSDPVAPTQNWTARFTWHAEHWWTWSCAGIVLALAILMMSPTHVSEFLYYQF
jgi:D-alanyl-lipoteichoic acid acyltransferase DltB (MBOAT superfamily)